MPRTARQPEPPPARPWDRLPAESPEAFEAFRCYLAMQPKRSLARVSAALGKGDSLLARWSARHRWVERCSAKLDHDCREREAADLARSRAVDAARVAAAVADGVARYRALSVQQMDDCRPEAAYREMVETGKVPSFATANDISNAVRRAKYRARKSQGRLIRAGMPARYFQHPLKPGRRMPQF